MPVCKVGEPHLEVSALTQGQCWDASAFMWEKWAEFENLGQALAIFRESEFKGDETGVKGNVQKAFEVFQWRDAWDLS